MRKSSIASLADEIVIEPNTKKGRQKNEENEDRLSNLHDCVILHILSFLNTKNAVQTCILSTRWKHLWKRIPALILHTSGTYSSGGYTGFDTLKSFDKFMSRFLTLRDGSVALQTLDFGRHGSTEPHFLKRIANYVFSHSTQLQRLGISVNGDSSLILPCISSCRALTSLKLSIHPKGYLYTNEKNLFPKSMNLPALTTLNLTNFAFCASDNAGCAEPFSGFNSLNSLTIASCTVRDAQILSITSATLVNLTMEYSSSSDFTKIELSAPNLSTFTFDGVPHQKLCAATLSSVKQLDINAGMGFPFGDILLSWLTDLPNIESLTVTSDTLLVLSSVPDLLNVKLPSLCNLKSLKVKLEPLIEIPTYLEDVILKNKSRKEAAKIKKACKSGLEPVATILDNIVRFLLQNSPSAEVRILDCWVDVNLCRMIHHTSLNEDEVEKSQPNTHFRPPR